ncbi:hypothetical protein OHB41_38940 [Streptomyces sp. NBC_01571]|nr:hypothetical protein [Streptomyces sp. NBC_01571]MCX4579057.1 hypothetical protein [Streptomyces sp. NBC_01571]
MSVGRVMGLQRTVQAVDRIDTSPAARDQTRQTTGSARLIAASCDTLWRRACERRRGVGLMRTADVRGVTSVLVQRRYSIQIQCIMTGFVEAACDNPFNADY